MAVTHPQCADRVRRYFSGPDGKDHYFRLLGEAERMIRTKHWCIATAERQAPGGQGAVDLFGQVYVALVAGRRSFPDDCPVDIGIRCILRSVVSHLALGFENTHRQDHLVADDSGTTQDHLDTARPFWDPTSEPCTEEQPDSAASRCARFIAFCAGDRELVALLELIRDEGIDGPAKLIAQRIGVTEFEVYNIRKRLATAVRKFERKSL